MTSLVKEGRIDSPLSVLKSEDVRQNRLALPHNFANSRVGRTMLTFLNPCPWTVLGSKIMHYNEPRAVFSGQSLYNSLFAHDPRRRKMRFLSNGV